MHIRLVFTIQTFVCRFAPVVWQHSFVEVGHEIISKAILSLPLIQVRQLSVAGKKMCTKYWLTAYAPVSHLLGTGTGVTVYIVPPQDKPGGTFYPRVKCPRGQDTVGTR